MPRPILARTLILLVGGQLSSGAFLHLIYAPKKPLWFKGIFHVHEFLNFVPSETPLKNEGF